MEGIPVELWSIHEQHSKHREMLSTSGERGHQPTRGPSPANAKMSNVTIFKGFYQEKVAGSGERPFLCPSVPSLMRISSGICR